MAQDFVDTLMHCKSAKQHLSGHSTSGGKAVMALIALAPDRIDKLVAIDMAPVTAYAVMMGSFCSAIDAVGKMSAKLASKQQQ